MIIVDRPLRNDGEEAPGFVACTVCGARDEIDAFASYAEGDEVARAFEASHVCAPPSVPEDESIYDREAGSRC